MAEDLKYLIKQPGVRTSLAKEPNSKKSPGKFVGYTPS